MLIDGVPRRSVFSMFMKTKRRHARKAGSIKNTRWIAYATASGATAMVAAQIAEQNSIHYSGPINQTFNAAPGTYTLAYFQLDQPGDSLNPVHVRTDSGVGIAFVAMYGISAASVAGFSVSAFQYASKLAGGLLLMAWQALFRVLELLLSGVAIQIASGKVLGLASSASASMAVPVCSMAGPASTWMKVCRATHSPSSILHGPTRAIPSRRVRFPSQVHLACSRWVELACWLGGDSGRKGRWRLRGAESQVVFFKRAGEKFFGPLSSSGRR